MPQEESKVLIEQNLLNKLQRLATAFDDEGLTRQEFTDAFQQVINLVLKIDEKQNQAIESLKIALDNILSKIKDDTSMTLTEMKKQMDELFVGEKMANMEKEHKEMMMMMKMKIQSLKNGRDGGIGLEGKMGPKGDPGPSPSLEMIKMAMSEPMEEFRQQWEDAVQKVLASRGLGAGGGKRAIYIQEAPTETPDGSRKDFTLSTASITDSLQVFVNGQLQRSGSSREYTLAGKTVTFNSANKPQTGDTIWFIYEKLH